jgi:hypothetical protein
MQAIQATYKVSSTTGIAYISVRAGDAPRPKRYAYNQSLQLSDNLDVAMCRHANALGWGEPGNVRMLCASTQSGTRVGVVFRGFTIDAEYCTRNLDDYKIPE